VNCRLHGPVRIGRYVLMGPEVMIFTSGHGHDRTGVPMIFQGMTGPQSVCIEDDVWIGARAVLLPGVTIGRGSIVGAGAVVARTVEPYCVVAGNPARVVRRRVAGPQTG
jgi:maltose O-acetyltransferase